MKDGGTRERILDVALDLFVEHGYDKTSLREIAERVGYTKAALYYHFPGKADLLMALHQRIHGLMDGPLSLLGEGPVDVDMFEKFLDACIDGMQANQKLFMLHRVNQTALQKLHVKAHEGAHEELEERARKIFSQPSLSPSERQRMAAAFAVALVTPMMAGGLFLDLSPGDDVFVTGLRQIVHQVLRSS